MAGTDMNAVVSLMQDTIQTQQNSLMQGLASTAASSGKTGADFEEYMKASVSTTEESKSSRRSKQLAKTHCNQLCSDQCDRPYGNIFRRSSK